MRSNDAFIGFPHDFFAFTMLQEIVARMVGLQLGEYKHAVGSFHIYDKHIARAKRYLREGWQSQIRMPPIPSGDPTLAIASVLELEARIRKGRVVDLRAHGLDPYWDDLVRILQIYACYKRDDRDAMSGLSEQMTTEIYKPYIDKKRFTARRRRVHRR